MPASITRRSSRAPVAVMTMARRTAKMSVRIASAVAAGRRSTVPCNPRSGARLL
jgi:hypothetical protein